MQGGLNRFRKEGFRQMANTDYKKVHDSTSPSVRERIAEATRLHTAAFSPRGVIHRTPGTRVSLFSVEGTGDNRLSIPVGHRPPGPSKRNTV